MNIYSKIKLKKSVEANDFSAMKRENEAKHF